jgi:hypothetical protein
MGINVESDDIISVVLSPVINSQTSWKSPRLGKNRCEFPRYTATILIYVLRHPITYSNSANSEDLERPSIVSGSKYD